MRLLMKKENIISNVKTAAVVATAVLSLNTGCKKTLTEQQRNTVEHKTDSAVNQISEYRLTQKFSDVAKDNLQTLRSKNRKMVKEYTIKYIKNQNYKQALRQFMLQAINDEAVNFDCSEFVEIESEEFVSFDDNIIAANYLRNTERWFYDLMLYLNNNYTDRQLLNSEFFKVINDKNLKANFEKNAKNIEYMQKHIDFFAERGNKIYNQTYTKYENEVKNSKQR